LLNSITLNSHLPEEILGLGITSRAKKSFGVRWFTRPRRQSPGY
jgi:hypothetical protein